MRNFWTTIGIGIAIGLLSAGIILFAVNPFQSKAVALLPTSLPRQVVIEISGSVRQPGVYTLPPHSRIQNAIDSAGGLLEEADIAPLNLASEVTDGQKIVVAQIVPTSVPSHATPTVISPTLETSPTPTALPQKSQFIPIIGLININTASLQELDTLPGIGPSKAAAIIDYRQKNGPFDTIEDIMKVSGIGQVTFEKLKSLITV